MKFVPKSELPELINDSIIHFDECYSWIQSQKLTRLQMNKLNIKFKEFWDSVECPEPIIFIKRGIVYITRDKSRFKGVKMRMSKNMKFVSVEELPKTNRGASGKDYLSILNQIPVGQMWIPEESDKVNVSTWRKAIADLEKSEKIKKGEFEAVQRSIKTGDKTKIQVYVIHNEQ